MPADGPAGLFASSNYDEMHETLDRFFTLVEKPEIKVEKLQLALAKYRGKENDLFDDLEFHYGVPVRVFGTISLIRRYYRVYDPSMSAEEINENLTHSKGRENLLLEFCAAKYGVSVLDVCISTSQKLTKEKEKREEAAARLEDPIEASESRLSRTRNSFSSSPNPLAIHHSSSQPMKTPQIVVQSPVQQQLHQQVQQQQQLQLQLQQQLQQQHQRQHVEVPSESPSNSSNRRLSSYQNALLIQDAQNARRGSTMRR